MKTNDLQLAKQIVHDSKSFIEGNIADYMILEIESNDNNLFQYLTEDEILEIDTRFTNRSEAAKPVIDMLRSNFNYNISEYDY